MIYVYEFLYPPTLRIKKVPQSNIPNLNATGCIKYITKQINAIWEKCLEEIYNN